MHFSWYIEVSLINALFLLGRIRKGDGSKRLFFYIHFTSNPERLLDNWCWVLQNFSFSFEGSASITIRNMLLTPLDQRQQRCSSSMLLSSRNFVEAPQYSTIDSGCKAKCAVDLTGCLCCTSALWNSYTKTAQIFLRHHLFCLWNL